MARFIDADKLIWQVQDSDKYGTITKQVFISLLQNSETADVAPVIHAHWVHRTAEWNFTEECSKCHFGHDYRTPFCPHCGAKMDEEVENG